TRVTTPVKVFCATGTAGCRNVVDNGRDRPTDPDVACAHTTCCAPSWGTSTASDGVRVARDAHQARPATALSARASVATTAARVTQGGRRRGCTCGRGGGDEDKGVTLPNAPVRDVVGSRPRPNLPGS